MGTDTYAKYVSSATSVTQTGIARWRILVNNDDITLGSTSTSVITPVFPGNSDISSNVLAPNAEGYFDLAIDATNVDVSFSYSITIAPNEDSPVNEIIATKYVIDGGQEINLVNTQTISGTVTLGNNTNVINIRVYVKWDDSLGLMTNSEDTDATIGNQQGMLDVTISAIQI
jgi:hypothetical protein